MKVNITSKEVEINDDRAKIIRNKLISPLNKYLQKQKNDPEANLIIKRGSRWGYRVSLSMLLPKHFKIYASTKQKEFTAAITNLREQLEVQIKEYKDKLR